MSKIERPDIVAEILSGSPQTSNNQDILDIEETSTGSDVGKSAVSGGLRGLLSLLGLGGDIQQISRLAESSATAGAQRQLQDPEALANLPSGLQRAIKKQAEVEPTSITDRTLFPTSQQVISTVEPALPILGYEPKTSLGRIAQSAGEFAGGGVPGKISAAPLAARTIGFGGIGATGATAEEVLNVPQEAVSLPLMAIAGGVSSRVRPLEKALADTQVTGKARETMQAAKELDFPLTAVEAMEQPELDSLLLGAMRREDSSKDIAEKFITPRATASEAAVSKQLEGLLLPDIPQPKTTAKEAQEASKAVMGEVRKERTNIVEPFYKAAESERLADTQSIQSLIDEANSLIKSNRYSKETVSQLNYFIKRISDKVTTKTKEPKGRTILAPRKKDKSKIVPTNEISRLDSVQRDISSRLKLPQESPNAVQQEARGVVGALNQKLDDILVNSSDNIRIGREKYKEATIEIVDDIGDTGIAVIEATPEINMNTVVDVIKNESIATPTTITKLANALNQKDPEVFSKIASYYLRNAAKSSVKPGQEITSGAQFAKTVAGTKADKERLDAILTGVARAKGLNPKTVTSGFDKLLDVMFASGRLSQMKGAKVKVDVPSPTDKGLLSASFVQPGKPIGDFFARRRNQKFFDGFTKALMSDDALTALEELAGASVNSRRFQALVSTIIASSRELAPTVETE